MQTSLILRKKKNCRKVLKFTENIKCHYNKVKSVKAKESLSKSSSTTLKKITETETAKKIKKFNNTKTLSDLFKKNDSE